MPLDTQAYQLLEAARRAALPPVHTLSVADARIRMAKALTWMGLREPVDQVVDLALPTRDGPRLGRLYRNGAERCPAVLFFHGGGWVLNSVDTHDHICRALANASGCAVISVDYRLAPEHPFPAANEDAWDAYQWLRRHAPEHGLDPERLAVAGDSSGGTVATVLAAAVRDAGEPLAAQVLWYPVASHWSEDTWTYREHAAGYSLSRDLMIWFWHHYLPAGIDWDSGTICPLRRPDLSGLAPAFVQTAEFDPLCAEGEAYAGRLAAAGVTTVAQRCLGMMHGYVAQFKVLDRGRTALHEGAEFLRWRLQPEPRHSR